MDLCHIKGLLERFSCPLTFTAQVRRCEGRFLRVLHWFCIFPLKQELQEHVPVGKWKLLAGATNPNHRPVASGHPGSTT